MSIFKSKPAWLIGILLIVAAAVIGFYYIDYRASGAELPTSSAASQISIGHPQNGAELTAYEPLTIDALAAGPNPFLSIELWINGELVSVQTGPSEGQSPLEASFAWLPKDEGAISLIARAIDNQGQTSTSPAVQVFIGANEDAEEGFTEQLGDVPAVAPAGGGFALPSGPTGPAAPAEDWNGSPGDWINSLNNDQPPTAPELLVQGDAASCTGDLLIRDLSDNEDGFAVFFQLDGGSWIQTKTLASQSQNEWIELAGVNLFGGQNSFYVSAFNSQGEAQSNLVSVFMDHADCLVELVGPPSETAPLLLQVKGLSLLGGNAPDKLYCYRSLNGGAMLRWPLVGYFYPDQNGQFALEELLDVISGQLGAQTLSLYMECWGWFGETLQYLGNAESEGISPALGGQLLVGDLLQAEIVFETLSGEGGGKFGQFGLDNEVAAVLTLNAGLAQFKYIYPPDMVIPAAKVTYSPEECTSHLPPSAQNLFGTLFFCFPYPGFHGAGGEGNNPQPYLVWNFSKTCSLGYGTQEDGGPCTSYEYWRQQAAANNGKVGFYVHDHSSSGQHKWVISADQLRMFNIPPNGCHGSRTFYVQMWYEEGGFTQYGPWSNGFTIDCPKPVGSELRIKFTFNTLTLSNIDDGDSGAQDVEVYGYFQVMAPSSYPGNNNYIKMGTWDKQDSDCSDDTGPGSNHRPSCPRILGNGTHNLANIPLCLSTDYTQANNWQCTFQYAPNAALITSYQTGQNSLTVDVSGGDAITLWVILHDWDDASANDLVCWGFTKFPSMNNFQWHAMDGKSFSIVAFGDVNTGSTCNISGSITVVD
ncbi:MAG: hypothetical protein KIS85_07565 [Anaerolineales bacterium]|nr:hypothetical protein [Anaerolineales bacterium]